MPSDESIYFACLEDSAHIITPFLHGLQTQCTAAHDAINDKYDMHSLALQLIVSAVMQTGFTLQANTLICILQSVLQLEARRYTAALQQMIRIW